LDNAVSSLFKVPLIDLGEVEDRDFSGGWSPEPEVGAKRRGVDRVFLDDAEAYYKKYQGFDYWRLLIKQAIERLGSSMFR
jgi:hypothetical protein